MGQAVAPKTWWISSYPRLEFLPFKIMTLFERFVDVCCKYAVLRGINHFSLAGLQPGCFFGSLGC